MNVVFDLDNTICKTRGADFSSAEPMWDVIKKMRHLKSLGVEIYIYTARGQNSCGGDLEKINEKYRYQIMAWLFYYDVPCDKLIFGKPLADLYVDDKGVSLDDFMKSDFEELHGNSGSMIQKIGNRIIKSCGNAREQAYWYDLAKEYKLNVPAVNSVVLDSIDLEYIDGTPAKDRVTHNSIMDMMCVILRMSRIKDKRFYFDVEKLIERVKNHVNNGCFDGLFGYLRRFDFKHHASFCHGDFSLSNIILKNYDVYMIDPIFIDGISSYLLDFAKLRFSLDGGEDFLDGKEYQFDKFLPFFDDEIAKAQVLDIIIALECTYWLRLIGYVDDADFCIRKAETLFSEINK